MVDKPRRRKQSRFPVVKVSAAVVAALIILAGGWAIYTFYIYKPPPLYARVDTSLGSFEVELYPACAPQTVANFVSLVNSGFYNNLVWHRIVKGFVIQTGDPNSRGGTNSSRPNWGLGGSNKTVPLEVGACSWIGNYEGYLGMARQGNNTSGLDTGTSQFFVNLSNSSSNTGLTGYYTVFGKVISGMSVVQDIGNAPICQSPSCPSTWQPNEPLPAVFLTDIVMLPTPPTTTTS